MALSSNAPPSNTSSPVITSQTPLPLDLDKPFLTCVNSTIGNYLPLVNPGGLTEYEYYYIVSGAFWGVVIIILLLRIFFINEPVQYFTKGNKRLEEGVSDFPQTQPNVVGYIVD
jgi:hypothetical protein